MKRMCFLFWLLSLLLTFLLGTNVLAESESAALIKPEEIKLYHNNEYIGETIVVGRGRQTYLYFTVPEDGFTSVKLNLQNQWGAAWGQTSEGSEKVWDTIYVRICTPIMVRGITVKPELHEGCDHVSCNRNRTGAISVLFRYNTINALTGETVEPTLQFAEMGRDMGHSLCDIAAASTFAMMTWIQDTKVDPVTGEVSTADDAVLIWDFLDERIMSACNLFYKYNLGYEIPWYPIYTSEGSYAKDGKQEIYAEINPEYGEIGRTGDLAGIAYIYYRYYLGRKDLDTNPNTMYLSMGRANAYPEGNEQDWIGWVDLIYTPADAAPFDQKSLAHTLSIQGENCTWNCDQTEAVFGELVSVHVTVAEGYTLQGATVTVNGVKLDVARNITYSGSDTVVTLVFGMPQEDAYVVVAPLQQ